MIEVLRLGHRRARDARISTHVCLTARAFGADAVVVAEKDTTLEKTVNDVCARFGGPFTVRTGAAWKTVVKDAKSRGAAVVHLTMYGEAFGPVLERLRGKDVLLVVGAEKVPPELYKLADHNVSIGTQPHSEVAALALSLDRLTRGEWTRKEFEGELQILPNPRGKTLMSRGVSSPTRTGETHK
jgi:tRNA (cytidine56-2'-O)-methyltransferase